MDDSEELNEIAEILLKLSSTPVIFSSRPFILPKWSRTKKRSARGKLHSPEISPNSVIKPVSRIVVGDKTHPQSRKRGAEELSLNNQMKKTKSSSNPKQSPLAPEIKAEMRLNRAEVGGCHRDLPPLISIDQTVTVARTVETVSLRNDEERGFDLNFPLQMEALRMYIPVEFLIAAARAQVTAEARRKRLDLMRSKKLSRKSLSHRR